MTARDYYHALRHQFDVLAERFNTKVHAYWYREEPSATCEALTERYMKRRAAIERKIDAELRKTKGVSFALLKAEFDRDLNGIVGELLAWQERLDAAPNRRSAHDPH